MMGESPVAKFVVSSENFVALMSANFTADGDGKFTVWIAQELVPPQSLVMQKISDGAGSKGHNYALTSKGRCWREIQNARRARMLEEI